MTSHKYLFRRKLDSPPSCPPLAEPLHRHFPTYAVLRVSGNQVGNCLTVPGDSNGLSVLHFTEKLCQMCLGLSSLNFTHESYNQLF